jgi:hypothetical protein
MMETDHQGDINVTNKFGLTENFFGTLTLTQVTKIFPVSMRDG